ncbi:NAD-dependent succinate-semialdehyde dehydrogenase [Oricola cellulosilytica]|uniref:NAD-dependent succinate-semialdehyde dehydrogenase n=1 Tax=Oricola cellulosilytica TaxID=1429082 RepID=A0A4R0PC96_9HYPH|nr:NAD-dependent succinate-semialdehyde dehydrogenase [Oricola cellulosilytica]TCD15080.1 NAD-dependent succinate-semialdehyde dehydrogenase [Oricola cellulosilytica]
MPTSINPATGETIKEIAGHSDEDIERALTNAKLAFDEWKKTSFAHRASIMNKAADLLEERKNELARTATREMGKRLQEAVAEVEKCAWVCRYYAENAEAFLSDDPRDSDAKKAFVAYRPLGPVLAVMPWNFPYWQVFRFAAPTLMAGNVGLLKHASNVSMCALAIEEIFLDAGAPQGVFKTLVIGSSKVEHIIDDDRLRAVTLTGSGPAGAAVASAASNRFKPSVLELGGSDPFIVMPSADLEKAVETAVKARMINNGQSCIAAKRFIVHVDIYDDFLDAMKSKVSAMKIGDPMREDVDMGPLSSKQARDDIAQQVKKSVEEGATCVTGGKVVEGDGFFFEPTILANIPEGASARTEEFFGPVALVFKAVSAEDAIAIANDSPFGLGSSVWTRDSDEQEMFIREIEAGSTFVNAMVASDPRLPFGGIKDSGYGRELSREGILAFVNAKTVSMN